MLRVRGQKTALVAIGLLLIGAGCHTASHGGIDHLEDSQLLVLAPKASGAVEIVDMAAFDPGSAGQKAVDGSPSGGAVRIVDSILGDRTYAVATFASAPAAKDYWFDLDQHVGGVFYFGNSLSAARSVESGKFLVAMTIDGEFAGGTEYDHNAASSGSGWNPVPIFFRPEASMIPKGAIVEIHVMSASSLLDVQVGTGGARQSMLVIPYYKVDPLSGALFLQDGKLVASFSENGSADPESAQQFMASPAFDDLPSGHYLLRGHELEEPPHGVDLVNPAILLPIPLLGLLFVGRSPRRLLAVAMVATILMAGCAGQTQETTDEAPDAVYQPKVNQTIEDDVDDVDQAVEKKVGTVTGQVLDHVDIPVAGAHVSLLATNTFASTGPEGRFTLKDVPAGEYTMRIDAEDFQSLEQIITVQVAKVTQLRVNLAPPESALPDEIAHRHDLWGADVVKTIDQVAFDPVTHVYTTGTDTGQGACVWPTSTWTAGGRNTATTAACEEAIPFDFSSVILPGTVVIEVMLDWDVGSLGVHELGLKVTSPGWTTDENNRYLPRAPGEPFRIQVFPNEADPGHQKFSNWQFFAFASGADPYAPWTAANTMPEITATLTIHKGIVPFEPKHVDRWDESGRFVLVDEDRITASTIATGGYPQADDGSYTYSSYYWSVAKEGWVPAGTRTVEGRLDFTPTATGGVSYPVCPYADYKLGYTGANIPFAESLEHIKIVEDWERDGQGYKFRIDPDEKELDQWYQQRSNWRFWLLIDTDVHPYCYGQGFTLNAESIKDPSYGA